MMWLAPHSRRDFGQTSFASATILAGLLVLTVFSARFPFAHASTAVAADEIVIVKSQRTMTLLRNGKSLKTYKVAWELSRWARRNALAITRRPRVNM